MNTPEAKPIRATLTLLLLCASFAFLVGGVRLLTSFGRVSDATKVPNISISGEGEATVIPDVAEFSFTVDKTAATVAAAQNAATTLANQALAALKQAGIADTDVKTTSYNINPHYTYTAQPTICPAAGCPPMRQVPDGYEVSQTIDVKVHDTSKVGSILQTVGGLGVTNVGGISFTINDKNAGQDQARAAAIADAQAKAQKLASELGVHLGRVVSFQESSDYPRPVYFAAGLGGASKDMAMAAPSVPTGQNTVTSNVTVVYEIQ